MQMFQWTVRWSCVNGLLSFQSLSGRTTKSPLLKSASIHVKAKVLDV